MRNQYIETLIKLVELNIDDTWLEEFRSLRTGGFLPGGGAGSLNDWGPVFSGEIENAWYSNLYDILRFLFDNDLDSDRIGEYKPVAYRNNIRIIRCLNCSKSYQHPSRFETHIALDLYVKDLPEFTKNLRLTEILIPERSSKLEQTIEYRRWLEQQYALNDIKIFDFVSAKYVCPHCAKSGFETEPDLYIVSADGFDQRRFSLKKQNADHNDFEKINGVGLN